MPNHLYDGWCDLTAKNISAGQRLYLLAERKGGRAGAHGKIVDTVIAHYYEPKYLAARIKKFGLVKAAKALEALLPQTPKARSGQLGEILAAEAVSAILPAFQVPLKRLRWRDGRETAMRGEDVIGISREKKRVRFLKGESKSRETLTPAVVEEARVALKANRGRLSQHAMGFMADRLREMGEEDLALVFEEYLVEKTVAAEDLVHLIFGLSGNDASGALEADLKAYTGKIEQHAVNLRIDDHQKFIGSIYKK
jgi:hypothetical protein